MTVYLIFGLFDQSAQGSYPSFHSIGSPQHWSWCQNSAIPNMDSLRGPGCPSRLLKAGRWSEPYAAEQLSGSQPLS